jgi:hypothetical protein
MGGRRRCWIGRYRHRRLLFVGDRPQEEFEDVKVGVITRLIVA